MIATLDEPGLARFGEQLGRLLVPGDVVLLDGPMGAGKTTLVRAVAIGLQVDVPDAVCSPTFTLAMRHDGPRSLMHVDLCRLDEGLGTGEAAFESLGLEYDDLATSDHVLVVEWAELWLDAPADALRVRLARSDGRTDVRELSLDASGPSWRARVRSVETALKASEGL